MPTRIGLNAGWAMVGNVGGSGRFAYSVVGDCVNTASRLESLNKKLGTRIIARRVRVVEELDEIVSRPLGQLPAVRQGRGRCSWSRWSAAPPTSRSGAGAAAPDFAAALRDVRGRSLGARPAARFEAVLAAHPLDGPASFYRKWCEQYLQGTGGAAALTARSSSRASREPTRSAVDLAIIS